MCFPEAASGPSFGLLGSGLIHDHCVIPHGLALSTRLKSGGIHLKPLELRQTGQPRARLAQTLECLPHVGFQNEVQLPPPSVSSRCSLSACNPTMPPSKGGEIG